MSKFLRLIEENQPNNESGSRYTISIKGPAEFEDIEISGDSFANHIYQSIYNFVHGESDGLPEDEMTDNDIEKVEDAANLAVAALKLPTRKELKALKKKGKRFIFGDPVAKGALDIRAQAADAMTDLKGRLKV
jgi:hypothetical protein